MAEKVTMVPAPGGVTHAVVPSGGAVIAMGRVDLDERFGELGSINDVRTEVDDAYADMKTFFQREPDEVMRLCAGHSARLSYIRVCIQRIEDVHRQWKAVRTREVEIALEQLQNQFAIASRLHSVRELDYRMEQGAP